MDDDAWAQDAPQSLQLPVAEGVEREADVPHRTEVASELARRKVRILQALQIVLTNDTMDREDLLRSRAEVTLELSARDASQHDAAAKRKR